MGYLDPQIARISSRLAERHQELLQALGESAVDAESDSLAWAATKASIEHQLAIKEEIKSWIMEGKELPTKAEEGDKVLAVGVITWGAPPGAVWGQRGATVRVPYTLTKRNNPGLAEARERLVAANTALGSSLKSKRGNKKK